MLHLFGGQNWSFAFDRYNQPNAAIRFSNGYLNMPQGVYFNADYTLKFVD